MTGTDAQILAIGLLGTLALLLLLAHSLNAGLPESVQSPSRGPMPQRIGLAYPVAVASRPGAAVLAYQAYVRAVLADLSQRPADVEIDRWADDGGPT